MFKTIAEVKRANKENGRHFFDKESMAFFNSKIESGLLQGGYFITSEKYDSNSPRLYTIRIANPKGFVSTVNDFQKYKTKEAAMNDIKNNNIVF